MCEKTMNVLAKVQTDATLVIILCTKNETSVARVWYLTIIIIGNLSSAHLCHDAMCVNELLFENNYIFAIVGTRLLLKSTNCSSIH